MFQKIIDAHYIHHGKHTKGRLRGFWICDGYQKIFTARIPQKRKKRTRNPAAPLKSQYLYLLINLICLLLPFIASMWYKSSFHKSWKDLLIAIVLPASVFIAWDELFARLQIWGFNSKYITGWSIGSLPVEEILFFVCIPYAYLFTYYAFKFLAQQPYFFSRHELLSYCIIVVTMIGGIYNIDKAYTAVAFLTLAFYLAYITLKLRVRFPGYFYVAFAAMLLPFFIVNGILTGGFTDEEVVWYNDQAILGLRLGTIPVEDVSYAMLLFLMNVSVYEWRQQSPAK